MKKNMMLIIVISVLVLALGNTYAFAASNNDNEHTRIARTVYIYNWTNVDVDIEDGKMHIQSNFNSVFQIDDTIWITDEIQWYTLGGRHFFIQPTNGNEWEAVFIGEIDGFPQVIRISFNGELVEINSRGIIYSRGGMIYYKSFYPEMEYHENSWQFPEKQGWGCDAPSELGGGSSDEVAVKADAPF